MSDAKISGIFDPGLASTYQTGPGGTVKLPFIFVVPGSTATGDFQGKINLKSPTAAFSGKGSLRGTATRTDQLVYIMDLSTFSSVSLSGNFTPVKITPITIPGSKLAESPFTFRGTRLSTQTSSTQTQTAN
ncbi:MAG: hypothetical protein EBS96_05655 [Spartobacteria bacterium]|nr:hypothetical protein [Spartobacteria bacterium]